MVFAYLKKWIIHITGEEAGRICLFKFAKYQVESEVTLPYIEYRYGN
jgi:hypothetical protein